MPPIFGRRREASVLSSRHISAMKSKDIPALLKGGDRRMIGRSDEVAEIVAKRPRMFPKLIAALWAQDALVRMRAADAAEKVTRERPELLQPYKQELLALMAETREQEVQWHLAMMIPRMRLTARERQKAMAQYYLYLGAKGSIVRTSALQGLTDLTRQDASIREAVIEILREAVKSGTAAMKARSRHLLARMDRE
jgi:hypothetical protein